MGWSGIKDYGFGSKHRTKEQDAKYRAMSWKPRKWTKNKCIHELEDLLDILKKILKDAEKINKENNIKRKAEIVRDATSMMNRILDFMRYLYPPVQENVNVNIDMTSQEVIERLKKWKEEEDNIVIKDDKNE